MPLGFVFIKSKLYSVEQDSAVLSESPVLFTWEDACEVLTNCRRQFPECRYVLREFDDGDGGF